MKTIEIDGQLYLIDIEKAKEQGLLKEKDSKPRSWEEYEKNNSYCYVPDIRSKYNYFNSIEEANAFCALGKLIQLRDAWWGDWKPDWHISSKCKYAIKVNCGKISKLELSSISTILAFPTKEMRDDFLKTFRDMIEQAKMFL